jgi:OmpA-OmpF porin, OOP family
VAYLAGKGIERDRLVAKGYGETSPVAANDTDENRQLNRRTEFKVLE